LSEAKNLTIIAERRFLTSLGMTLLLEWHY